jgi:hypothetical protein
MTKLGKEYWKKQKEQQMEYESKMRKRSALVKNSEQNCKECHWAGRFIGEVKWCNNPMIQCAYEERKDNA